jgi:hypothetical protein
MFVAYRPAERLPHPEVAEYLQLLTLSPSTQGLGHLIQEVARTDATVLVPRMRHRSRASL